MLGSKTFTAVKAGTATITVKSESNQDVFDTFQVTVWEPADITGTYTVESLEIQYEGVTAKSSEVNSAKPYNYDKKFYAVSTEGNVLDITGKIDIVWSQFIDNPVLDTLRYRYFSLNESLSDRENSKDKLAEKGFTFNGDGSLTYEFPFTLGADNTLEYSAGSSNKLIFKLTNKQAYAAVEAGKTRTFTPVHFEDPYSIQGTYDISDFTQQNKHLSVGTRDGLSGVERMIGELTVNVNSDDPNNRKVDIISKIQMNSSSLDNPTGMAAAMPDMAREGQFQRTVFNQLTYSSADFGNKFGYAGDDVKNAEVSMDGDYLHILQKFKQGISLITVDVTVKTWMTKKSDEVKDLPDGILYFGYMSEGVKSNAYNRGYGTPPEVEPSYDLGLIN